ncbi:MAG: response regulator [Bacteroidota bacterium]
MIRVLVADDHAILRDGIRSLLESQEDILVVGEAENGQQAIESLQQYLPDIVLMDISMPGMNGLEATRFIRDHFPQIKVLILTQHENREYIAPALQAGAAGYVLKRSGRRELLNALRQVHEQGAFLPGRITSEMLENYARDAGNHENRLTQRERQVLQLIVDGKSNKEIAVGLGISPKTVSVHRTNAMAKLNVQTTVELIRFAASNPLMGSSLAE